MTIKFYDLDNDVVIFEVSDLFIPTNVEIASQYPMIRVCGKPYILWNVVPIVDGAYGDKELRFNIKEYKANQEKSPHSSTQVGEKPNAESPDVKEDPYTYNTNK